MTSASVSIYIWFYVKGAHKHLVCKNFSIFHNQSVSVFFYFLLRKKGNDVQFILLKQSGNIAYAQENLLLPQGHKTFSVLCTFLYLLTGRSREYLFRTVTGSCLVCGYSCLYGWHSVHLNVGLEKNINK